MKDGFVMNINKFSWKKCVWVAKVQIITKKIIEHNTINYNVIYIHYIAFTKHKIIYYILFLSSNTFSSVYLHLQVVHSVFFFNIFFSCLLLILFFFKYVCIVTMCKQIYCHCLSMKQ